MEPSPSNKIALFEHPICQNIFVFKTSEGCIVFGTLNNFLYVTKLTSEEIKGQGTARKKFDGEVLHHDRNIVGVVEIESKYYGIDQSCCFFTICEEVGNDSAMDYDIFEDSPEKRERWVLKDKKVILVGKDIISYCQCDKKIALLVNSDIELTLEIIDLPDGLLEKSLPVRSPGLSKECKVCTMIWIAPDDCATEFKKNWFLNLEGNSGFFVVTMPEGNILIIDPNQPKPEFLFAWPFPAVCSCWSSVAEDVPERALIIATNGNSIVKMSQYGEIHKEYLPIDEPIKVGFVNYNILYVSNRSETVKYSINETNNKTCILFLKGILCFGSCEQDFTFALSNNGEVYALFNNNKSHEMEMVLPDSSLIAVLMEETTKLDKVGNAILECDAYIEAINLAKKSIPFSISAQVICTRKFDCSIGISLKCLEKSVLIEKLQGWNLFLSLKVGLDVITLSHKLQKNISSENELVDIFSFSTQCHSIADVHIKANLVYTSLPKFSKLIPALYVGEIYLDSSYFLQPALEAKISDIDSYPTLNEVLKKGIDSKDQEIIDTRGTAKKEFQLNIQYDNYPKVTIFKQLLNHSKPLWRSSLWDQAGEKRMLELGIMGHIVAVEDFGTHVLITGKDIDACYAMKRALLSSIPGTKKLQLPFEALKQLDVYERTADIYLHENATAEEVEKLRESFRKTVTSQFKI